MLLRCCGWRRGGPGAWSIQRYITILQLAQFPGYRSHCPKCQAYARFKLLHSGPRDKAALPAALQETPLLVVCRKCGAGWRM